MLFISETFSPVSVHKIIVTMIIQLPAYKPRLIHEAEHIDNQGSVSESCDKQSHQKWDRWQFEAKFFPKPY